MPKQNTMPLPLVAQILENKRRARNRQIIVKQGSSVRTEEARYRKRMNDLIKDINKNVGSQLPEMLKSYEPEYITDAYAKALNSNMTSLAQRYRTLGTLSKAMAAEMVNGVNTKQRDRFYGSMEKALGVNLWGALAEEGIADVIDSSIAENVSLIQSIPDEYFKKLFVIVNEGTKNGNAANEITKQVMLLGQSTFKRAKLIARDQTSKANASITQQRQQSLGVTEYRWRTVGDEAVRPTHAANNGKIFKWSEPPAITGHPSHDINCRCVAEPVINIDELLYSS